MSSNPPDHRGHLAWIKANQVVVLGREATLAHAIAFVAGFDAATGYSLLRGFQEWLVLRAGSGHEVHWMGLARQAALDRPSSDEVGNRADNSLEAIDRLFQMVDDFLGDVDDRDGRRALYRRVDELRRETGLNDD